MSAPTSPSGQTAPAVATPPPSLTLIEWRPLVRNSLRGFASVRLRNGLTIRDMPVHASNGRSWASLPAKPLIGRDGQPMRDAAGKVKYSPFLEWPDRATADRFSAAVLEAVEAAHPGATA